MLFLLALGDQSTVRSEFGTPSKKAADSAPAAGSRTRRRRRKAAALQGVRRSHGKSLDKPDAEPAGESCEALQSANAALRKQLDDAADQLASRRQTLRALAERWPGESVLVISHGSTCMQAYELCTGETFKGGDRGATGGAAFGRMNGRLRRGTGRGGSASSWSPCRMG